MRKSFPLAVLLVFVGIIFFLYSDSGQGIIIRMIVEKMGQLNAALDVRMAETSGYGHLREFLAWIGGIALGVGVTTLRFQSALKKLLKAQ